MSYFDFKHIVIFSVHMNIWLLAVRRENPKLRL